MSKLAIAYASTAAVFLSVDLLWLGVVAKSFYQSRLGDLLLEKPNLTFAVLFYLIYVIGIIIFAVEPALKSGSWQTALIYGALFGFFTYATYDITNLATLKSWPTDMAIVDIVWGSTLTGTSAVLGYLVTRYLTS